VITEVFLVMSIMNDVNIPPADEKEQGQRIHTAISGIAA
jgi:hypothetical protein